jgi:hypothetical protein
VPSLLVVDEGPELDDEMTTGEEGVLREAGANESDEAAKSVSAHGGGGVSCAAI